MHAEASLHRRHSLNCVTVVMANNNSSCLTVDEGRIFIVVNSLFASLGSLANVLTIFLIVWTRAYRKHVHRLTLYLASFSLCFSIAVGFETLPLDASGRDNGTLTVKEGWGDACAAIGFIAQHVGFSRSLAVLGVCFYVFMLAICDVKLKQRGSEVAGLMCIAFLPSVLSWVPFLTRSYGLTGAWCWIEDDCTVSFHSTPGSKLRIGAAVIGDIVPISLSVIFIVAVTSVFCWRLRYRPHIHNQHLLALKELLPLVCYPIASAVSLFCGAINSAALHGQSRYAGEMLTVCLMQSAALFLPLSLLLHPSVRQSIRLQLSRAKHVEEGPGRRSTERSTQFAGHDQTPSSEKSPLIATS